MQKIVSKKDLRKEGSMQINRSVIGRKQLSGFYKGKRVLVTGHTGFKGSWLCRILLDFGAEVHGYALEAPTEPALFEIAGLKKEMHSVIGDIRDLETLTKTVQEVRPDVILHLAAQPIVRTSYQDPVGTYESNVMGTVNILEQVRQCDSVRSFLNVTTDKVYENKEWPWGYRENERLDGYDPYSNSKSCSELVTHSYRKSFFTKEDGSYTVPISTARAGNVIGGGDFAKDRIVPDCVRAMERKETILVRNPYSTRPYQHVLEPLSCYLMIAAAQWEDSSIAGAYNVGPDDCDCVTTGELVDLFCSSYGSGAHWENRAEANAPHEANFLKLDCSKMKSVFGWEPKWHIRQAMDQVCEWSRAYLEGADCNAVMERQIRDFFE